MLGPALPRMTLAGSWGPYSSRQAGKSHTMQLPLMLAVSLHERKNACFCRNRIVVMDARPGLKLPGPNTHLLGHLALSARAGKTANHRAVAVTRNVRPVADFSVLTATQLSYRLAQMTTVPLATAHWYFP
jgi:hypothetical protein